MALFGVLAALFSASQRPRQQGGSAIVPHQPGTEDKALLRQGHERTDASVGWIFAIVVILAVSGIAIHLLLWAYLHHLEGRPAPADSWQPMAGPAGGPIAPSPVFPRLQVSPPFDLAAFRKREETLLSSYGRVEGTPGRVHVPISVAMDLFLKKGVPVRSRADRQAQKPGPSAYDLQLERVQRLAIQKERGQ